LKENRPLRIKDIYHLLEKISPPVDVVTIYRTIEILRNKDLAHRVDFGEDATYYELTLGGHNHHYITCTSCAKHSRVDFCLFEEIESQVLGKIPDFSAISGHIVEFLGLCKKCSEKKSKKVLTKKSTPILKSKRTHTYRATVSRR
jgi:Fe2+ or Zn2+ uptake regulation protein